jgi:hypothetical protein
MVLVVPVYSFIHSSIYIAPLQGHYSEALFVSTTNPFMLLPSLVR